MAFGQQKGIAKEFLDGKVPRMHASGKCFPGRQLFSTSPFSTILSTSCLSPFWRYRTFFATARTIYGLRCRPAWVNLLAGSLDEPGLRATRGHVSLTCKSRLYTSAAAHGPRKTATTRSPILHLFERSTRRHGRDKSFIRACRAWQQGCLRRLAFASHKTGTLEAAVAFCDVFSARPNPLRRNESKSHKGI